MPQSKIDKKWLIESDVEHFYLSLDTSPIEELWDESKKWPLVSEHIDALVFECEQIF